MGYKRTLIEIAGIYKKKLLKKIDKIEPFINEGVNPILSSLNSDYGFVYGGKKSLDKYDIIKIIEEAINNKKTPSPYIWGENLNEINIGEKEKEISKKIISLYEQLNIIIHKTYKSLFYSHGIEQELDIRTLIQVSKSKQGMNPTDTITLGILKDNCNIFIDTAFIIKMLSDDDTFVKYNKDILGDNKIAIIKYEHTDKLANFLLSGDDILPTFLAVLDGSLSENKNKIRFINNFIKTIKTL